MKAERGVIKCGRVVIVGRPNTGKSTLINTIMNKKVGITSPMPQTTRRSNRVTYRDKRGVIYFSDTPGIIAKVEDLVGKAVNLEAPKELARAEVVVMLVDISREKNEEENKVIGLVRKSGAKKILVYNKIDKAVGSKDHLADYNYLEEEFDKTIAISALKSKNIKGLMELIFDLLPTSDKQIEEKESEGGFEVGSVEHVGEIIREKAYLFLRRELPYSITTEVEKIKDKGSVVYIKAKILTTSDRYKAMIVGQGGRKIKEIGTATRKELEVASNRKIFLDLMVVVDKHWPERAVAG